MQLSSRATDFSNLVLKHFGQNLKHSHEEHEEYHGEHEHEETVEPKVEEVPKTNKDKYSLDYSKWTNLEDEEKQKQLNQAKNTEEEEYKKMFGCFHDRRKERQLYEKSTREKLDAAERFKKEGNKFFQSKDYAKADVEYQKALIQFDYAFPDEPKEEKEMEKLQEQCHTNMALVKFYMKDYKECIHHCNLAIKLNTKSSKARYRKACALLELHDYDKALEEIKEGMEVDPTNQEFPALKQKVHEQNSKYEQKTEKIYKKIFETS